MSFKTLKIISFLSLTLCLTSCLKEKPILSKGDFSAEHQQKIEEMENRMQSFFDTMDQTKEITQHVNPMSPQTELVPEKSKDKLQDRSAGMLSLSNNWAQSSNGSIPESVSDNPTIVHYNAGNGRHGYGGGGSGGVEGHRFRHHHGHRARHDHPHHQRSKKSLSKKSDQKGGDVQNVVPKIVSQNSIALKQDGNVSKHSSSAKAVIVPIPKIVQQHNLAPLDLTLPLTPAAKELSFQKSKKTQSLASPAGNVGRVKVMSRAGNSSQRCLKNLPKKNHSPLTSLEKTQCPS